MIQIVRSGEQFAVVMDGHEIARCSSLLYAARRSLGMLHDGMVSSVTLPNGVQVAQ